jgi:hypothetical protein
VRWRVALPCPGLVALEEGQRIEPRRELFLVSHISFRKGGTGGMHVAGLLARRRPSE